jgi:uncharacterized membrane protein YadS
MKIKTAKAHKANKEEENKKKIMYFPSFCAFFACAVDFSSLFVITHEAGAVKEVLLTEGSA